MSVCDYPIYYCRAGSEASSRVSMSFYVYIYIYICCNAGRGLGVVTCRGRDSINMNGGRGIPATFEAEAACWLEGLAGGTQQQPRGKEASSAKTQECLLTCNRSSQKDGRSWTARRQSS